MKHVVSAQGAFLVDEDGNRLFDAISSWWVTTLFFFKQKTAYEM